MGNKFTKQRYPNHYSMLLAQPNQELFIMNINKQEPRRILQKDIVFMPQPPTGAMATKMNLKTYDNRVANYEIEAKIKNIKKPIRPQKTNKLITQQGLPANLSAANPLESIQQE